MAELTYLEEGLTFISTTGLGRELARPLTDSAVQVDNPCAALEVDRLTADAGSLPAATEDLAQLVSSLFEAYAQPVCAYIHSLVNDWQLAHDLTQETYLALYQTRDRLPQVVNRRAWVYRIATHLALNERKRRKRFAWLPWSHAEENAAVTWGSLESTVDACDAVERALAALPPDYRAPLLLYSGYDFSVREIAEALEISEGAVKTRLHRAREMFRKVYDRSDK